MKHTVRLFAALFVFVWSFAIPVQADTDDDLEDLVEALTAEYGSAVSLRVTIGDETWAAAGGLVDLEGDTEATPDSRFRIGSISKTFVAVVLLQLAEEDFLTLEDRVGDWLSDDITADLANAEDATLLQLVTMTAGIPEYLNDDFFDAVLENSTHTWTAEEVLVFAYGEDALFDAGDGFEYVNTNYILLQLVIEAATGQPLHEVIRERILDPLDLEDTYTQIQETLPGGFVHGYEDIEGDEFAEDVTLINDGAGLGDGGLISTTADLTRFYQALFGGELLSDDSLEMMIDAADDDTEYGMGLEVFDSDFGLLMGHTGGVLGFSSAAFYAPDLDATVVILYATPNFEEDDLYELLEIAEEVADD